MTFDAALFKRWDVVAMCVAMSIVFTLEMLGVFTNKYVTITAIVRGTVPRWARAMICGWLYYHFVVVGAK